MAAPVLTFVKATPGQLVAQIVGDGEAGNVVITQALMAAALANGPLKEKLLDALPTANQANARAVGLGTGVPSNAVAGQWNGCANVELVCRASQTAAPGVDADLDAVEATKLEYNVDIPAVAMTVSVFINYRHSILG